MDSSSQPAFARPDQGFALVLVLAFVALLIGICLAFFSNAFLQGQISNSSATQVKVDLLAQGAVETTVADLEQEITDPGYNSSIADTNGDGTKDLFIPKPQYSVPEPSSNITYGLPGSPNGLENLVKVSKSGVKFYSNAPNSHAANAPTTEKSRNGRSVTLSRWNKPLLMPAKSNLEPNAPFPIPDWILITRNGTYPTALSSANTDPTSSSYVTGRYAYAIYDEGGLLDVNVAGHPSTLTADKSARRPNLAFADLAQIPGLDNANGTKVIDALVGWRNFASGQASGSFPAYTFGNIDKFYNAMLSNTSGFLSPPSMATLYNNQSDHFFTSRQQLIDFFKSLSDQGAASLTDLQNALQYLTTFSREINQPSYAYDKSSPVVLPTSQGGNDAVGKDAKINPGKAVPTGSTATYPGGVLSIRAKGAYPRNDGSTATVGEPLVRKRFNLNRLAWLTYQGPSANNMSDQAVQKTITALGGNPSDSNDPVYQFVAQGTTTNIQKYFGLRWNNGVWSYDVHDGSGSGTGEIMNLGDIANLGAGAHEPDFFELLKAGINVGSVGKSAVNFAGTVSGSNVPAGYTASQVPANHRFTTDTSVDYQIIQIGANIINQFHADNFPRIISFDDGIRGVTKFAGVTDLPYLAYIYNGVLRKTVASPPPPTQQAEGSNGTPFQYAIANTDSLGNQGEAVMVQVPVLWNIYDPNGTAATKTPSAFRIVIDSNDPRSLAAGLPNAPVWVGSSGTPTTTQGGGVGTPIFSYNTSVTTGHTLSAGAPIHDELDFSWNSLTAFREPTLLFRQNSGGISVTKPSNTYVTAHDPNPINGASDPANTSYAPFVLGSFPLRFVYAPSGATAKTISAALGLIGPGGTQGENRVYFTYQCEYQDPFGNWQTYDTKYARTSNGRCAFIFVRNPSYSPSIIEPPEVHITSTWAAAMDPRTARFGMFMGGNNTFVNNTATDATSPPSSYLRKGPMIWINAQNGVALPIRPDNYAGHVVMNYDRFDSFVQSGHPQNIDTMTDCLMSDVPYPRNGAGWAEMRLFGQRGDRFPAFSFGIYAQNNPDVPFYTGRFNNDLASGDSAQAGFYCDPDGVVRRGASAYLNSTNSVSGGTPIGQPAAACINSPVFSGANNAQVGPYDASPFSQSQSRPLMLHRPFRSVAELGYVFRDLPWKNLDFFTPESGDSALLDVFCVSDTSNPDALTAGKVNLNTRQVPVLSAIVSGAYVDDPKVTNSTVGSLSPTLAKTISTALITRRASTTSGSGPFTNVADLVGRWVSASPLPTSNTGGLSGSSFKDGKRSYSGFSGKFVPDSAIDDLSSAYNKDLSGSLKTSMINIQRFHEAPIRALSAAGQTRTWNLLIDIIAQSGHYAQAATSLNDFNVEGEQRYWVHLAIDRLTGKIVDKQVEVVKE